MEFSEHHTLHSRGPTPMGRPWVRPAAFGVLQLCMHKLGRESMTDMLTTAALIERVDAMDAEELDRLQAAIDRRRRQLAGDEVLPTAGPSSTVVQRRAYGSGVLQLEKRGESGPYWYFHHRKDGKQKTIYLGKTNAPEIKLAQLKGGIGG
jgi:hypothetical protein